jgi:predicted dienelactone hydrolase
MNSTMYRTRAAGLAVIASLVFSTAALAVNPGGSGPDAAYAQTGPNSVTQQSGGTSCTIYRPTNLTTGHPVILWGNGTGSSPSSYAAGLRHLASHGFVVAAANTSNAGTGTDMLGCLSWLTSSSLRGSLNLERVGTSGHSQGGGGSIMAGRDSRIDATAPVQPYTIGLGHQTSSQSQQRGPMLLLSGSSDTIASPSINQAPVFSRANVPVFWATRNGASHFEPVGDFGDFRGITTAWFLYQLRGDATAGQLFTGTCRMCSASGWSVQRKGF